MIDDDPWVRETLVQMTARLGLDAHGVVPDERVFDQLRDLTPDLVVLDLSLGRSDAVQVLNHLALQNFSGLVLLVSGIDPQTLDNVRAMGARRGLRMMSPLRKPVRSADLARVLSEATEPEAGGLAVLDAQPTRRVNVAHALAQGWLELWYQPKICVPTGKVVGAEALIRMRHPELGIIPPVSFVPASGSTAYEDMTQFVIETASRHHRDLPIFAQGVKFSINASIALMQKSTFVDMIRDAWPNPFAHPGLIIEVTEDEVVSDILAAHEVATQLKLHNVELSIDDFGSGYSSFSRFRELPFAELKLDRSFVTGAGSDLRKRAVCRAASALAHSFHVRSVAEGVESAEDLAVIRDCQFDEAQGYYFARPVPFDAFRTSLVDAFNRPGSGDLKRHPA
ncbi:EAL domain-containing response regulator [Devosia enhydra]|uniref:EAL domain-containing response regulator n=1 Tax=Devosia enhydra TaxID=665118 RepID=UPI0009314898|nr:EAL domain-containing response regulator [Devosia enhydra]